MMDFALDLLSFCAVPMGFVSATMDSNSSDDATDDCSHSGNREYLVGFPPDILQGTAPFADPHQTNRRTSSVPLHEELHPSSHPREKDALDAITPEGDAEETVEGNSVRSGVERIREIKQRYRCVRQATVVPSGKPSGNHQALFPRRPRDQETPVTAGYQEKDDRSLGLHPKVGEDTTDDPEVQRHCGCLLRQIADQFERDHAKIPTTNKGSSPALLTITVPAALTSCLTASFLFLAWWRLYNKFR